MAVDTANKRISVVNFGQPLAMLAPVPDASVGTEDTYLLGYVYSGIPILEPPAPNNQINIGGSQPARMRTKR